jgi:hypothetical protein
LRARARFDDPHLALVLRRADARAVSRHLLRGPAGQSRGQGAGRRGVADAHFPGRHQVEPLGHQLVEDRHPGLDGGDRLLARHGRSLGHVGRSGSDFALDQVGMVDRGGHADVHDHDARPYLPRERIDGGAAAQEILHHLRRDLGGIGAHALGGHPVIAGQHHHSFARDGGAHLPGDPREVDGDFF